MLGWQAIYAHARNLEKKNDWQAAAVAYERLLRGGENENPKVLFRLGHAYFRLNRLDEAKPLLARAVALQPENAAWHYRVGFVLERQNHFAEAIRYYRRALEIDPTQTAWLHRIETCEGHISKSRLDMALKGKGPTWQVAEILEAGLASHSADPGWAERLGDAHFKMGRYAQAADAYARCARIRPEEAKYHFKEGWAWQLAGDESSSESAYKTAVSLDARFSAREVGIGAFFEARGQWPLAALSYEKTLSSGRDTTEVYYRLGLARQKTYDWKGAVDAFQAGLKVNPASERLYWRLGLSYERMGDLRKAEENYSRSLSSVLPGSRYWKYRLGHVLRQQGKYKEASIAYYLSREDDPASSASSGLGDSYLEQVLARDIEIVESTQSAQNLKQFGVRAEALGCNIAAADAYAAAAERSSNYDADLFFRVGRMYMLGGRHEEAASAFAEIRQFKRPHAVDTTQYMKNKTQKQAMFYTEYMETLSIQDHTILYESGHGATVAGNPLHLFRAAIDDPRFSGFKHVWVLNSEKNIPEELAGRRDVIFAPRDSDLYLRYLASVKYLINDNTFPPYFIRREEQCYLNTWHGTPIKTLGRDIKSGLMDHKNAARNFLHATHIIAPNQFTADCLIDKYDVAGLFNGKLAVTGYPRVDAILNATDESRRDLRDRLGIPLGKKVVLYAPTWRGSLADRSLDSDRLLQDLEALGAGDWHFLYRGHTMTSDRAKGALFDMHSVPATVDTNDLLAIVDVLITDYSSIFFDFIPTGRPIIYYTYDLESYERERGLYFDITTMPGTVCRDLGAVIGAVNDAVSSSHLPSRTDEDVQKELEFCPREDGQASIRVLEFFFFGSEECLVPNHQDGKRKVLMFQGSFLPNGITTSYLNLVSHIDQEENNVYVVVDPDALASKPERLEKFAQNPSHIRVLARVGSHVLTPEERWVIDKMNTQHNVSTVEMWEIINRAFAREFRRVFGAAVFDSVICFEGYARFWTALLGNAPIERAKKSVYLHNDMYREWKSRFEYLEANFRLFQNFDSLISVTQSVGEENALRLSDEFGLDKNAFTFCNNLVNPEETLRMAEEPLDADIAAWVNEGDSLFVTLGRLSPEKGHAKLIHAFADIVKDYPGAKLAILGDGPLHEELQQLIDRLRLQEKVLLAGRRMNPFAILKNADCFVFSSDYEGQGLVVLEALILDRPVISTDVVGPRSVLEGGYGLLVENSVDGLTRGFHRFFRGDVPREAFNYEAYQKEALDKFARIAL
ncbi:CDP-glycerol glycerophosphotransferase family protein [Arthrobacter zhangbolii]|uniref:CDP-glycerol glycerophosphotransferase family protein n=1 Tax=Arthrobacter zhangbolii TaxID=2886936 RepID=A0A9X1M598_9MICC|nr:CDP-glycerol glycerophosphotransferase family protein [Arthrobacter zhangbolii]MCC3271145.1 CDP-glycerol glycerophosphotransferase family protein [Arthrobacter zhangbolii]UON91059.1 CDP-glycerol glycerophosphotransferase family protein [Arthrobacter zhangbolii]